MLFRFSVLLGREDKQNHIIFFITFLDVVPGSRKLNQHTRRKESDPKEGRHLLVDRKVTLIFLIQR